MKINTLIPILTAILLLSCVNTDIPAEFTSTDKDKEDPVKPPEDIDLGKSVLVEKAELNLEYELSFGKKCKEQNLFLFDMDTGTFLTQDKLLSNEWEFYFEKSKDIQINNLNSIVKLCTDKVNEQSLKGNVLCTLESKSFDEVTEAPDPLNYKYNVYRNLEGVIMDTKNTILEGRRYAYGTEYRNYGYGVNTKIGYYDIRVNGKVTDINDNFGEGVRQLFSDRTFIFKTSEGNYAKLQILCFYKDCPKVPEETKNGVELAVTFRYFVQKDGSRNLQHKE